MNLISTSATVEHVRSSEVDHHFSIGQWSPGTLTFRGMKHPHSLQRLLNFLKRSHSRQNAYFSAGRSSINAGSGGGFRLTATVGSRISDKSPTTDIVVGIPRDENNPILP